MNAVVDEELLEGHHLIEESRHLGIGREAHDALDAGPVVPGPIEERDLTTCRELFDVPLEVPLTALGLVGNGKGDMAGEARVHVLAHALDRAALAGRVAPSKSKSTRSPLRARPLLHLHQFDLECRAGGSRTRAADLLGCRKDRVTPLITRKIPQERRVEVIHHLPPRPRTSGVRGPSCPASTQGALGAHSATDKRATWRHARCLLNAGSEIMQADAHDVALVDEGRADAQQCALSVGARAEEHDGVVEREVG